MSSNEIQSDIQQRLAQLLENKEMSCFTPLIEKLKIWSSAKMYSTEFYEGFIELIQKMHIDIQKGISIGDVLERIDRKIYIQPEWKVHSVYQNNGNVFETVFNILTNEVRPSVSKPNKLPVILLVMDADEAEALNSLSIFSGLPRRFRDDFIRVKRQIDRTIPNWKNCYQKSSEEWIPFVNITPSINIQQLVNQSLTKAQDRYRENYKKDLMDFEVSFMSAHSLNKNRLTLKKMRRSGCIIIMDMISMCHPIILKEFQKSMLDASHHTAVVTFAPIDSLFQQVSNLTAALHLQISELEFAKRQDDEDDEDYDACKKVIEQREFQRWLRYRLEKTIEKKNQDLGILANINQF